MLKCTFDIDQSTPVLVWMCATNNSSSFDTVVTCRYIHICTFGCHDCSIHSGRVWVIERNVRSDESMTLYNEIFNNICIINVRPVSNLAWLAEVHLWHAWLKNVFSTDARPEENLEWNGMLLLLWVRYDILHIAFPSHDALYSMDNGYVTCI